METLSTQSTGYDTATVPPVEAIETEIRSVADNFDADELAFELGAWLAGMSAFASPSFDVFDGEGGHTQQDPRRRFRIVNAALMNVAKTARRLQRSIKNGSASPLTLTDVEGILDASREALVLGDSLSTASELTFAELQAWNKSLTENLLASPAARSAITHSLSNGETGLPESLRKLFDAPSVQATDRIDIDDVLPRVGTALRFLDVVGEMLRKDLPLKPALLIFAAVHEQTRRMIDHINARLARFPNEEAALFNPLDSASYSASLELKKVFQQELKGIVGVLPPTSVYARIETAYSLLLDSYQQILTDLARSVDGKVSPFGFFPRFQIKLDQSLILREHLYQILKAVRAAEEAPEKANIEKLKKELADFVTITIRFLHYKDEETFDRFNEEVHAAREKKDLVPILHRFGAYLETLFGQICMRGVLADHPFEQTN